MSGILLLLEETALRRWAGHRQRSTRAPPECPTPRQPLGDFDGQSQVGVLVTVERRKRESDVLDSKVGMAEKCRLFVGDSKKLINRRQPLTWRDKSGCTGSLKQGRRGCVAGQDSLQPPG